jgi:hypothetical protein
MGAEWGIPPVINDCDFFIFFFAIIYFAIIYFAIIYFAIIYFAIAIILF